jgi:thiamine biosynthesis lipoprotein
MAHEQPIWSQTPCDHAVCYDLIMASDTDIHSLVIGREAMACRFEIVFNAGEHPQDTEAAIAALDVIDDVESQISIYRDSSELTRLNATAAAGWQQVSPNVFALLEKSLALFEQTGGGFDITAGRLVRTWGFLKRQGRTPTPDDLAAAVAASGSQWVQLDPATLRVRFTQPGVELNPGAIGKGWALDRAVDSLMTDGIANCLLHGGSSSVRAIGRQGPGPRDDRRGWPVGIRHPLRPGVRLATVDLADRALGTSGSGTQFFIDRGRRLGHILDPRTGHPAEGVLSATVLAPTAAEADALATAAYVLGPAGLPRIAPAGGPVSVILTQPGEQAKINLIVVNVAESMLSIDDPRGVWVDWRSS